MKINGKNLEKNDFLGLEPFNPTLTLQMKFTINEGVLRPLETKIGAKNSLT